MLRKLKTRFVFLSVISVAAVLIVILSAINIVNYIRVNSEVDARIELIISNGGSFPSLHHRPTHEMTPEAPYETRYFSVIFNESGKAVMTNVKSIAAISEKSAHTLAASVLESGRQGGYIGEYKYRAVDMGRGHMVVFVDCSRDLATLRSFLSASAVIALIGLGAVLAIAAALAGVAVRPIAETYEKQKRFITDASHELKTPLSVIEASTEVLEIDHGESQWTSSIKNQVERLTSLTNDLVSLSRLEEGGGNLMIDFPISDAVADEASSFEKVAERAGRKLTTTIEPNLSYHGDERSIRRLIGILTDNALKHSVGDGEIAISLSALGKGVKLVVSNPCTDLPSGDLTRFFERFRRGDESRTREGGRGGYGIGLSIALAIVQSHRGKISACCDRGVVRVTVLI